MSAFLSAPSLLSSRTNVTSTASTTRTAPSMTTSDPTPSRRSFLHLATSAAVAAAVSAATVSTTSPAPALADGAFSPATRTRARGIYGNRVLGVESLIAQLEAAVEGKKWAVAEQLAKAGKGKKVAPGPIAAERNAFALYASGALGNDRALVKKLGEQVDAMYKALAKVEKAADDYDVASAAAGVAKVRKAYTEYKELAKLDANNFTGDDGGQYWSTDYDFHRNMSRKQIITLE